MSVLVRVPIACAALLLVHDSPLAADAEIVEVWVVLSEPALARVPRDANEQRNALRRRLAWQQDDVMAQLAALGAVETARIQHARNAIAVRLRSDAIDRARKIEGVISIHPVTHHNRIDE